MEKHYSKWKKVITWVREDFIAESDELAIDLAKSDDYECYNYEWADDMDYIPYGSDSIVSDYPITEELYDVRGNMLWNNEPIEIKRNKKLNSILDEK